MIGRLSTVREVREALDPRARSGATIALVPTMGALHEGHLSLVRAARERADEVVVSVFVNPTQFGPDEDFERYPRTVDEDIKALAGVGATFAFTPGVDEMYGGATGVAVRPGALAGRWEGELRPGHFEGVATVVTKLFGIVRPDVALFGEKDFQQLRVIQQVAVELDLGVEVVGCPIVRDADGLALSSRNRYLSPEERDRALSLSRALDAAAAAVAAGEDDAARLAADMARGIEAAGLAVDYATIVDPATLEPLERIASPSRALLAARIGTTRLIDNASLVPGRN